MHTLRLLNAFLKVNIQMSLAYRADTVVNILLNLMWLGWELLGLSIIQFFGISLASFQVGGGLMLLVSAMNMLQAQPADSGQEDVDAGEQKANIGASIAVVPLTIPLLTGPVTISTMVIYAERTSHWWEMAVLVGYGIVIGLVAYVTLSAADRISRIVGQTGINVMTRLMGLILAALAIEIMAAGLVQLFPVLATHLAK